MGRCRGTADWDEEKCNGGTQDKKKNGCGQGASCGKSCWNSIVETVCDWNTVVVKLKVEGCLTAASWLVIVASLPRPRRAPITGTDAPTSGSESTLFAQRCLNKCFGGTTRDGQFHAEWKSVATR